MRFKAQTRWMLLLLTLCVLGAEAGQAQAAARRPDPAVQAVAAISTTVADMDRSVDFYTRVLSFHKTSDRELELGDVAKSEQVLRLRVVSMMLGDESIELVQPKNTQGRPGPPDSRSNDVWFQHIAIIVSDMDRAYLVVRTHHVQPASTAPQRLPDWNKNAAGIRAFYFKDPDGHPLEILQFPAGKGDAKWHRPTSKLFLGIDHTAIVVSHTEASLTFYRDLLGFRVAGETENYGPEQEALNNVPGAHLRITSLRAQQGPGIELLEYLSPHNGRQLPYRPKASDLVHRHTLLLANAPAKVARVLGSAFVEHFFSAGQDAFVVHDPDGHELMIRAADPNTTIGEVK
jgi:catechol 2,3-dioxygenase-like lactoylglutathione lyase family enzyme